MAADTDGLCTLRDFVRWGASRFAEAGLAFGHGTDNALDEAFFLVTHALHLPQDLPVAYADAALTPTERARVLALLRARVLTRKPAAYLTGEAWFCGLPFHVDERVLVPRSPIAELIERRFEPWLQTEPARILDLCTGSGCIAIACALSFDEAEVVAGDLDEPALRLCARNIERHHVAGQVTALRSDVFDSVDGVFDLIVSNPPYVPTAEWQALALEYRHEPRMALDAGADGMDIVARILHGAPAHLSDNGLLVCEIGGSQDEFEARFPELPAIWPEFERGGDGVFVIARAELDHWLKENA